MAGFEPMQCPHCMFAFPPGDPRLAVPPTEKYRIVVCPGCRTPIRVWGRDGPPKAKGAWGCLLTVVMAAAVLWIVGRCQGKP